MKNKQKNNAQITPREQTVASYSSVLNNAKISKETMSFLTCILLLKDVSSQAYDAFELMYGESQAEAINERFYERYIKLENFLFKYLSLSINENIGVIDIVEI